MDIGLSNIAGSALGFVGGLMGQEFASDEASSAREFQQQMRSTQYQTAVADMKLAGLNPMLAYHQGGAQTGSAAQAATPSSTFNPAAMQAASQIELLEAQTEKTRAEAETERNRPENVRSQTHMMNAQTYERNAMAELLSEQAITEATKRNLNDAQTELILQEIENAIRQGRQINAHTGNIMVDTILKSLDIPKAKNEAEAQKSWYMKNIAPYTGEFGKLTGSAAAARQAIRPGGRITINPTTNIRR